MEGKRNVCRFCLKLMESVDFVMLEDIQDRAKICIPEMNPSLVDGASICQFCVKCLEEYLSFVVTCLEAEEKVTELLRNTNAMTTFLPDAMDYVFNLELENRYIKNETEDTSITDKVFDYIKEQGTYKKANTTLQGCKRRSLLKKYKGEKTMFRCKICTYETQYRQSFNNHRLTHKNPLRIKMFKCKLCSYKTKQKSNVKSHMVIHKNPEEVTMFKCNLCSYESKVKGNLTIHMITHKDPEEIIMFRCELCGLETKRKGCLINHMLTHKNPGELCKLCSYKAKMKYQLTRHMVLIHNSPQ